MILINLLPHREEARKRRKEAFKASMFASALLGLAIASAIYWWFQILITDQQDKNAFLQRETVILEGQIKEIASIEDEITALRARQKAVEDLQSDRNLPVHLLTELVKQLPDGIFITGIRQAEQTITMQGMTYSNEQISKLLQNIANNTPWLATPELTEIVAGSNQAVAGAAGQRNQRQIFSFNLRFQLVRASDAQKSIAAANAAAHGGK